MKFSDLAAVMAFTFVGGQAVYAQSSLPRIAPAARRQYVAALMWHDVVPGKKQVWFDTTTRELEAQLEAIRRRKCHVITLAALTRHLTEGAPLPSRPVLLTFDDNYEGIYQYAFPILKRFGYPATFFAHTDFVGVTTVKAHCTWAQLQAMEQSGLIEVQSQTCSHPADIRLLNDAQLTAEFRNSRAALEKHLGRPIYAITYPEDKYNAHVAQVAADCGYKIAFTEDWGNASASPSLMLVHRYSVHRRFDQALKDLTGAWK